MQNPPEEKTVRIVKEIKRLGNDGHEKIYMVIVTGFFVSDPAASQWIIDDWSISPLPFELTDKEKQSAFDALYREVKGR